MLKYLRILKDKAINDKLLYENQNYPFIDKKKDIVYTNHKDWINLLKQRILNSFIQL